MTEVHQGENPLTHSFGDAWAWFKDHGEVRLTTRRGTSFSAVAAVALDGRHVLRFLRGTNESGRAYECCWGHYFNCNKTRIGMYCRAADLAMNSQGAIRSLRGNKAFPFEVAFTLYSEGPVSDPESLKGVGNQIMTVVKRASEFFRLAQRARYTHEVKCHLDALHAVIQFRCLSSKVRLFISREDLNKLALYAVLDGRRLKVVDGPGLMNIEIPRGVTLPEECF